MLKKIQKWLYSTPDYDNDNFGCNIRSTVQSIFPCKHKWENDIYTRKCIKCGKEQCFVYYTSGNIRWKWRDKNENT